MTRRRRRAATFLAAAILVLTSAHLGTTPAGSGSHVPVTGNCSQAYNYASPSSGYVYASTVMQYNNAQWIWYNGYCWYVTAGIRGWVYTTQSPCYSTHSWPAGYNILTSPQFDGTASVSTNRGANPVGNTVTWHWSQGVGTGQQDLGKMLFTC